jgi:hypothetical protein
MKEGIQPQRLQLIGATALVVASKIEVFLHNYKLIWSGSLVILKMGL